MSSNDHLGCAIVILLLIALPALLSWAARPVRRCTACDGFGRAANGQECAFCRGKGWLR